MRGVLFRARPVCFALARSVLVLMLLAATAPCAAQAPAGPAAEYQAFSLRYKPAAEAETIVRELLSERDPQAHLIVDAKTNQILVRGSDEARRMVGQLVASLDRPPSAPAQSQPIVKAYRCPRDELPRATEALRARYARQSGIRIAPDATTEQLIVLAPAEIHAALAGQLEALGIQVPSNGSPSPPPATLPRTTLPGAPLSSTAEARPREQFVALVEVSLNEVESTLGKLFERRLVPRGTPGQPPAGYRFTNTVGQTVELGVDRHRNGFMVSGPPQLLGQWVRLIRSLDRSGNEPGKSVRVLPVRRADPAKVWEAVRAYRGRGEDGAKVDPRGQSSSWNQDPRREQVQLVHYELFQQAAPAAPDAPPAGPTEGTEERDQDLRELGSDLEVETLPDLDVIILRGRDQDVKELSRIIEEIERLSAETQPAIELVPLAHVEGTSLVGIIDQVSPDLLGGRQGRVSVTPLVKPNALLLVGWGDAVKTVKELIAKLDQPVAPNTQLRVFHLRQAAAGTAQATIDQFFQGRAGLGPTVQVIADLRTNALVVRASPRDMQEVVHLISELDGGASKAVNRARVFKLKNSLASDVAGTLQSAIEAARGGDGRQKATVLELLAMDAGAEKVFKSGDLSNVQITPDVRTNTLLVSAPPESMELLATLIEHLDTPALTAQIKVFRIVNGDANMMIQMLRSLLPSQDGGTSAPQLASAEGESALVPLRFSVDVRTNSIIATGSAGDLEIIEALLLRLDEKDVQQRKTSVYRLRNNPAADIALAVNDFLRSERQVQQAVPGAESPFLQIEREVVVVPERVSNALIISATPRFFEQIMELVEELDAEPPKVMIQVLIAEVALGNADEFGIELGLQDGLLFDRSLISQLVTTTSSLQESTPSGIITNTTETIVGATNTPGYAFNSQEFPNSGSDLARANSNLVGGQGLSNFGVGRINSELGFGGLVLSASSESVSVLVRALQQNQRLDVLARPQIMTLDNQPAFIQVGQRVPRIIGTTVNQTGQVNNIALENVGLILGVTPRISPDGMVVMEIDAEKSQLGPEAEGIPVAVSEGTIIRSPSIDLTTAQTTVSAANGETIVLGGLITKRKSEIHRNVPWLSDIPVLGHLFRYDSVIESRDELLIILTPHIVRTSADADRVKQIEAARMNWCLCDVTEIHGPTGIKPKDCDTICEDAAPVIYPHRNPRGVLEAAPGSTSGQQGPMAQPPLEEIPPPDPLPPGGPGAGNAPPSDPRGQAVAPATYLDWSRSEHVRPASHEVPSWFQQDLNPESTNWPLGSALERLPNASKH